MGRNRRGFENQNNFIYKRSEDQTVDPRDYRLNSNNRHFKPNAHIIIC